MPDNDLLQTIREHLSTAVVGDVLDAQGYTRQFLPPQIRAVNPNATLAGCAMTVLEADCSGDRAERGAESGPFGLMFQALDDLQVNEVYICTGSSPRYALWGEMMSTRAQQLGAAGAVLDGFHRDTRGVLAVGLPVFSMGAYAQDQRVRGRVIDYRCPIEFANGVRVNDGDIVVGDVDGVVIIPKSAASETIDLALEKVRGEANVKSMLKAGQSTQAVFDKTGIM